MHTRNYTNNLNVFNEIRDEIIHDFNIESIIQNINIEELTISRIRNIENIIETNEADLKRYNINTCKMKQNYYEKELQNDYFTLIFKTIKYYINISNLYRKFIKETKQLEIPEITTNRTINTNVKNELNRFKRILTIKKSKAIINLYDVLVRRNKYIVNNIDDYENKTLSGEKAKPKERKKKDKNEHKTKFIGLIEGELNEFEEINPEDDQLYYSKMVSKEQIDIKIDEILNDSEFLNYIGNIYVNNEKNFYGYYSKRILTFYYELYKTIKNNTRSNYILRFSLEDERINNILHYLLETLLMESNENTKRIRLMSIFYMIGWYITFITELKNNKQWDDNDVISSRYYFVDFVLGFPYNEERMDSYIKLVSTNILYFMNFYDTIFYEYYKNDFNEKTLHKTMVVKKSEKMKTGITYTTIDKGSFKIKQIIVEKQDKLTFYPTADNLNTIYVDEPELIQEEGFNSRYYFKTSATGIMNKQKNTHLATVNYIKQQDLEYLENKIPLFKKISNKMKLKVKVNSISTGIYEWIKNFFIEHFKSLYVFYDFNIYHSYYKDNYKYQELGRLLNYPLVNKKVFVMNQVKDTQNPVSILQCQHEINKIKWSIGLHYKLYIYIYVTNYDNMLDVLFEARQNDREDIRHNYVKRRYENDLGARLIIPLRNLPDYFLTDNIGLNQTIRDFYESYEDISANSRTLIRFDPSSIRRIEIGIEGYNIKEENGAYLPIRILLNNKEINEFGQVCQFITGNDQMYIRHNCFINCLMYYATKEKKIEEQTFIKIVYEYILDYISFKDIKEMTNKYGFKVVIRIANFNENNFERYKYYGSSGEEIRLILIIYGSFSHYIPDYKVEGISNYCNLNLDITNEKNYSIQKINKKSTEIKNGNLDDYNNKKGITRMNKNNKDKCVNSLELFKTLVKNNLIQWLTHTELEVLKLEKEKVEIDLNRAIIYRDITTETIKDNNNEDKKEEKKKNFDINNLWVGDTETYYDEKDLTPYCICLSNGVIMEVFYGSNCQTKFLNYCTTNEIYRIYFHNLKFDGWLFKQFKITNLVYHASKLYSLTIYFNNKHIELRDSLAIIPNKIANFKTMFKLNDESEKDLMPYELVTKKAFEENSLNLKDIKEYYDKKKYEEFIEQCNKYKCIKEDKIDLKKLTELYCEKDVIILYKGLNKFYELAYEMFNINVLNYLTISGFSYAVMVKNCFKGLSSYKGDIKSYLRESIKGGRCMLSENKKNKIEGRIVDFDACSLYPSAMHRLYLPTGEVEYSNNPEEIKELFYNKLMKEDQVQPDLYRNVSSMFLKIKLIKVNKERKFPLITIKDKKGNNWTNEVNDKIIYCSHIELEDYIKYQGLEFEFLDCIYWTGNKDIKMSNYIKFCYEKRKEFKKEGNPLQEILKLFMNSSYGKTIQKDVKVDNEMINPNEERDKKKLFKFYGSIKEIIELNENCWWVKKESTKNAKCVPAHIGSLILGMSKRIMNEVICLAEDNNIDVYYQDTDSIHMKEEDVPRLQQLFKEHYRRELIGTDMGQFHVDFPSKDGMVPYSRKSIFLGKKSYLDILVYPDGTENEFIRMKGIPESVIRNTCRYNNISVEELYEELYRGEEYNFDLLTGDNPRFEFKTNFGIKLKEHFERKVKF